MNAELSGKESLPGINHLRLIPFNKLPGKTNMAIDYYLSKICKKDSLPIIRFYGWEPYCMSIGCHQKEGMVNRARLIQDGFDFVRRPTGGRAIFHSEELTYSLIFSIDIINHKELYRYFHKIFACSLQSLGYTVELKDDKEKLSGFAQNPADMPCFTKSAQTEVQYSGKKIIGSAQKIFKNAILQHGSILIDNTHKQIVRYLRATEETKNSIEQELNTKTISLNQINKSDISPEKLMRTIINQLEIRGGISVNSQNLSEYEYSMAEHLLTQD